MENIQLSFTFNTRDLSFMKTKDNLQIKPNKLIRSGSLHRLSTDDIEILKKHHLKVVIDFRSNNEFINRPDVRIEGVKYYNFPALKNQNNETKQKHQDSNLLNLINKDTGGKKLLMNTYKELVTSKEGIEAYKNFFKIIQENEDGAILWHCSQGKDRAGLAAFLLEYALGVELKQCFEDYLYTNVAMAKKIKELTPIVLKKSNNDNSLLKNLEDVFLAKMEYLNEALETINKEYQSVENFLINILKVNIELLKRKYLE